MVRPFGVKTTGGGRNRQKKRQERFDTDENDETQLETASKKLALSPHEANGDTNPINADSKLEESLPDSNFVGIPVSSVDQQVKKPGVVFVLEKASLEVAKVGKAYQILNSEDHSNFLKKNGRDPASYRPDIAYQALLSILDSPLNKAGRVRAIYVRTDKGVLFEVKPHVRIPRTYKRFAGIMLQLLQKLSITAVGKREKLMRVIKNPVTQYLPLNSRKIGFSYSSDKLVQMRDYVGAINDDNDLVFVVGAMAHGKIESDYIDDFLAVSGYPLSAAWCISRVCECVAWKWNVL